MSFRYTQFGALMNEDKFDDAAKLLVEQLVAVEVERAKAEGRPVEEQTNKAEVARRQGVTYRTMSRWVVKLKDNGHDVEKQAYNKLRELAKEQRAA